MHANIWWHGGVAALAMGIASLGIAPTAVAGPADTYTVTVHFMEVRGVPNATPISEESNYQLNTVTFTAVPGSTELGTQGTVSHTDEGLYKSRAFVGWTGVPATEFNAMADGEFYSANNTIADLCGENLDCGEKRLYAYYSGAFSGFLFGLVPIPNQNMNKHNYVRIADGLTADNINSLLPSSPALKTFTPTPFTAPAEQSFAPTDRGATGEHYDAVFYYHPTTATTGLALNAEMNIDKGISSIIRRNQWVYGVGLFSQSVVNMTYDIPENVSAADVLKNIEFDSYTFRLKEVIAYDAGRTVLPVTVENRQASAASDIFDIAFTNPGDGAKTRQLVVVAEPKQRQTDPNTDPAQAAIEAEVLAAKATEYTKPMKLMSLDPANFTINTRALADDEALNATISGVVNGNATLTPVPVLGSFSNPITPVPSNNITIDFVYPKVSFDKNSAALGDTDTQMVATEVPATTETATTLSVGAATPADPSLDGYRFTGWNTAPDGSGTSFDQASDVRTDMTVYAQWAKVVAAVPAPTLTPASDCDIEPVVNIPTAEGVVYEQTRTGNTVTVTAAPVPGHIFDPAAETQWSFDVTPEACPAPTPSPKPTPAPSDGPKPPSAPEVVQVIKRMLPQTGSGVFPWLAAIGVTGAAAALVIRRRTR